MKISYKNIRASRTQSTLAFFVLLLSLITFVLWSAVFVTSESKELLEIVMLDVGQGDAFFIESPKGTQVLIDGGRSTAVLRGLSEVMPFWDRTLDVVVATHPDADHIGGLIDVFERFEVKHVLESAVKNDTPTFRSYEEALGGEGASVIPASRGTQVRIDDSIVLTVLSREVVATSDTNEASVILRIDYGETSFLFTGDASKEVERELLRYYELLDVDVLKVGHHGSDTSTSLEFISATSPEFALISAGRDNSYGHPHDEVLERLTNADVRILRTDTQGTVRLVSDGRAVSEKPLLFFERLFGILKIPL
ncbi:MAG: ComEC/Rec2 family competence protein [Candidatus Paceibacterota bacterium]